GFAVAWCYIGDTVLMELVHGTVRVAECGLAWGPQEASTLWEFLGLTAAPLRESTTASLNTPAPSMPRPPWLAVVSLRGTAELSVLNAVSLSGFECFLGLAL